MGARYQPYMYTAASYEDNDSRFPSKPFDPKAVTRASWERSPPKPKHEGPLVSFNRHPDSLVVPEPSRTQYPTLGPKTKWLIKWLRVVSLGLRVPQFIAAAGILFLMIIIDDVNTLTSWIMRITAGVCMLHCAYGIFHLARPAASRPPASSASYQVFSAISDLAVVPLYAYGCLSVRNSSDHWGTLLPNENLMNYFLPSLYYTLFAAAVLHLLTLANSLWLALKFRQISNLPPDMNPLEDNLTSRHQKKLSVAATVESDHHRPPCIPFHTTRSSPRSSIGSAADLPPRQYQITPANSSRNSIAEHSPAPPTPPPRSPWRASYTSYSNSSSSVPRKSMALPAQEDGYEAIRRRYDDDNDDEDDNDSDFENETATAYSIITPSAVAAATDPKHPNPLRSNPSLPSIVASRSGGILQEINLNDTQGGGGGDITDEKPLQFFGSPKIRNNSKRYTWAAPQPRDRQSSIQPEADFCYTKPYGELRSATPPVMVGGDQQQQRQVSSSSGNDYGDLSRGVGTGKKRYFSFGKRNVSGKIAEEGRGSWQVGWAR